MKLTPGKVYRLKTSGRDQLTARSYISRHYGYLFVYIETSVRGDLFQSVATGNKLSISKHHFEQGEDDGWQEEQA
jgi:hypothetical protein